MPINIHAKTTAHGVPIAVPLICRYNWLLNSRMLLKSTHRKRNMVNSRSLGVAPHSINAWLIASRPRVMSIDGERLSTSADNRAQSVGNSNVLGVERYLRY